MIDPTETNGSVCVKKFTMPVWGQRCLDSMGLASQIEMSSSVCTIID